MQIRRMLRCACTAIFAILLFWCGSFNAQAAEKISPESSMLLLTLESGSPGGDANSRTIRLLNVPADFESRYSTRWYSMDESVAVVTQEGVVEARGVGETTVYCEITRLSTGKKSATVAVSVTVQAGGGGVAITGAPEGNTMSVGDSYLFLRNMTERSGVDATHRTRWEVSDPEIAGVDANGRVTALAEGKFTLWARTYDRQGNLTAVSPGVTIQVTAGIREVTQVAANAVELTFAEGAVLPEEGDFSIREESGTVMGIDSVTFSEDGQRVTIKAFTPFKDGKTYTISAGNLGSIPFTAAFGEVTRVEILTRRTKAGEGTEIEYVLYHQDGRQQYRGSDYENVLVEGDRVELISDIGNFENLELTLWELEDIATVSLRYYPTGEGAYVESPPVEIEAVESPVELVSVKAYTITELSDGSAVDYTASRTSIGVGETGRYLAIRAADQEGRSVYTNAETLDGWYFYSLNADVLDIDGNTGELIPRTMGSAVIECYHNDFYYRISLTVTMSYSDITGGIVWYDDAAARPAQVELVLYANGAETDRVTVAAAQNWQHTWTGLAAANSGGAVEYTVKALPPAGYLASQEDSATTALYTAELTGAIAQASADGNVTITVTFTGAIGALDVSRVTVQGPSGAVPAQSTAVSGSSITLAMGALPKGDYTIHTACSYGYVNVTIS